MTEALRLKARPIKSDGCKHIRLKALARGGVDDWRFHVVDIETGNVLPVMASEAVIHYKAGQPITAHVTLILDELDVEALEKEVASNGSPIT